VERTAYPNPAVVAASKNLVCVVGHAGTGAKNSWDTNHGSKEIKQGTEKIKVCKLYNSLVCSDHVEIFKDRVPAIFGDKVFPTPTHVYYSPAGEELSRVPGAITPQALAKDMNDAVAKISGNHISKDDYDAAKKERGGARAREERRNQEGDRAVHQDDQAQERDARPLGQKELDTPRVLRSRPGAGRPPADGVPRRRGSEGEKGTEESGGRVPASAVREGSGRGSQAHGRERTLR
jgi:hypothetical protein